MITVIHHVDAVVAIQKASEEVNMIKKLHPRVRIRLAIETDQTSTESGWVAVTVNNYPWSYHLWPHITK